MSSYTHSICVCSTLNFMRPLAPEITVLDTKDFRYQVGPYLELDLRRDGRKYVTAFRSMRECWIVHDVLRDIEYRSNKFTTFQHRYLTQSGWSLARTGEPDTLRLRVSLWYLWNLFTDSALDLGRVCWVADAPVLWKHHLGADVRLGYGCWNMHADPRHNSNSQSRCTCVH
jgi:hypothetical protein